MKNNLLLIRDEYTDKSTSGKLYLNGEFIAYTLELPNKNNARSVSCIPRGVYDCRVRFDHESGSRDYDHILIKEVPNRSYILFHYGNRPRDTKGCILTGMSRKKDFVGSSRIAHTELMSRVLGSPDEIELVIKNR